jgi:MFS superfamily sulfate permease-like transporter
LNWPTDLQPKILTTLPERHTRKGILADVMAGVVVGVVALPLANVDRA